ncbi:heterokaryon incompatibility protein-domain-containing protein [Scleroderma citrinum]
MRLINVKVILQIKSGDIEPEADVLVDLNEAELSKVKYAILSHCWGTIKEEVQFKEMYKLARMDQATRDQIMKRSGFHKILKSCEQASRDDLWWVWVDTCCIDKRSSSELSEAINSMYRWYENSEHCYAYLHDIDESALPTDRDEAAFGEFNGWPKWFSRGWTLQELIAPTLLHFFNRTWECIGDKASLSSTLTKITRIPGGILEGGVVSKRPCVARVMSWAADRTTTRVEDRAYSLLGLLGVHMPMLYGEGKNAFRRLQLEIIRQSNDQSIFAWGHSRTTGCSGSFLADDPSCFRDCSDVDRMERKEFIEVVRTDVLEDALVKGPEERLRTFSVTNDGIQIWLPIRPCRRSNSLFEAQLACCHTRDSHPMTIVLARFQSNHFRYFCDFKAPANAKASFQQVFLPYQDIRHQRDFTFDLDLRPLIHDGFVRHSVFPDDVEITSSSVTLTSTNDCAVAVYECARDSIIFALSLCYSFGRHSVHIACSRPTKNENNKDFAARVYHRTRQGDLEQANSLAEAWQTATSRLHFGGICLIRHAHFPQSIRAVRMAYMRRSLLENHCAVVLDITQCLGCCSSDWQEVDDLIVGPDMPSLMRNAIPGRTPIYEFLVDSFITHFVLSKASKPEIKLGDYGRFRRDGSFEREGNISDLATKLSIKKPFEPVEHRIHQKNSPQTTKNIVKANSRTGTLVLHDATATSLPTNDSVFSLLKSLSMHLADRHLVSTIIRCSECFSVEEQQDTVVPSWSKAVASSETDDIQEPRLVLSHPMQVPKLRRRLDTTCPLYTVTTPLIWYQEAVDVDTWTWFHEIR